MEAVRYYHVTPYLTCQMLILLLELNPTYNGTHNRTNYLEPYNFTDYQAHEAYIYTVSNHTYNLYATSIREIFQDAYCYNNQSIQPSLESLARCQPSNYFVWGVSGLLVRILFGVQIVWICGMYLIWLDANLNSVLCRNGRKIGGPFRAVTDLAEAMKEVIGDRTCAYTHAELAGALQQQSGVRYYSSRPDSAGVAHIGLSSVRARRVILNGSTPYGKHPVQTDFT